MLWELAPHCTKRISPKRSGACGPGRSCMESDQMLMRRFGSTPSQRFRLKLHAAPGAGFLENSSKLTHGMETSRLQPRSLSLRSFRVPLTEAATLTPSRLNLLKNSRDFAATATLR